MALPPTGLDVALHEALAESSLPEGPERWFDALRRAGVLTATGLENPDIVMRHIAEALAVDQQIPEALRHVLGGTGYEFDVVRAAWRFLNERAAELRAIPAWEYTGDMQNPHPSVDAAPPDHLARCRCCGYGLHGPFCTWCGTATDLQRQSTTELAPRYVSSHRLGALRGCGGFASVYTVVSSRQWFSPPPLCIKVGYGDDYAPADGPPPGWARATYQPTGIAESLLPFTSADIPAILSAEAAALRAWESDLFPQVHDAGIFEGSPYYVMDDLGKTTLRAATGPQTPLGSIVGHFTHLLENLMELQSRGLFRGHGDLKPENILVTTSGLRLIDPATRGCTPTGGRTLTVQCNPLGCEGEFADTSAIAIMLFEMATGEQPFAGYTSHLSFPPYPPWVSDTVERRGKVDAFLNLGRFDQYQDLPALHQCLEWIHDPPRYEDMHQALSDAAPEIWNTMVVSARYTEQAGRPTMRLQSATIRDMHL